MWLKFLLATSCCGIIFSPEIYATSETQTSSLPLVVNSSKQSLSLTPEEVTLVSSFPKDIKVEDIEKDTHKKTFDCFWPSIHSHAEKALKEGNKDSQLYIGHIYKRCIGDTPKDEDDEAMLNKAIQWMLYSLRDNDGQGEAELGLYSIYKFQKKDDKRAEFWIRQALLKGSSEAKEYFVTTE